MRAPAAASVRRSRFCRASPNKTTDWRYTRKPPNLRVEYGGRSCRITGRWHLQGRSSFVRVRLLSRFRLDLRQYHTCLRVQTSAPVQTLLLKSLLVRYAYTPLL